MASLEDLAAMREREAAAAAAETARIAVSMRRVANEYKDVYAPLQDDTLLLMQTLTANVDEIRSRCSIIVEVACGAAPPAVLLAKLLGTGSAAIFATDLSSSAIAAASVVAAGSKASIELCRGELLSAFRAGRADLVVCLPPYVASKRMSTADAVAKESAGAKQLADAEWVFLGGSDGLEVLGRLAADLVRVLSKTGFAFICIGNGHDAHAVAKRVEDASHGMLMSSVEAQTDADKECEVVRVYRIERCE